jgi:S1-C subfamily serine protease
MMNTGLKVALLVFLAVLAVTQLVLLAGYYVLSASGVLSSDHRRNLHGMGSRPGSGGGEVQLVSCSTEDLGVAVSRIRSAVVYITGHRTASGASLQPRGPISFSAATLAGDKMGSGIIFDPRGYILTNYHVIADTTDLRASVFGDREKAYPCEIVTADPNQDLAVLKIDTPYSLPKATLGNSDMLEAGDEVLAIGCPFNLEQSVTHGVVSDTKRSVTIDGRSYKDLIQTDAAINSGNSGGALINESGEVVGINVAIYAPSKVYCGVGFAIPVNQAKLLLMKIKYLQAGS